MGATCDGGWDSRWHQEIDDLVKDFDQKFRGNGSKGLIARTELIESYIASQVEREKEEKKSLEEREKEAKSNRTQYKIMAYTGVITLIGLLILSIFDHTMWKHADAPAPPPVVVQQTTTTDTTSTTTKIQKPVKP